MFIFARSSSTASSPATRKSACSSAPRTSPTPRSSSRSRGASTGASWRGSPATATSTAGQPRTDRTSRPSPAPSRRAPRSPCSAGRSRGSRPTRTTAPDDAQERAAGKMRFAVEHEGFNLHGRVRIAAGNDLGRERLARYGARPALALDRLRRLPGGRVAYRVKYARHGAAKHRVMTSLELMARLAALVPPPRYPLVRFHGVLGPRSSWRRDVVPRPPAAAPACERVATATRSHGEPAAPGTEARADPRPPGTPPREKAPGTPLAPAAPAASRPPQGPAPGEVIRLTPSVISVAHWQRLHDGALLAASSYVDWASLLRRTFEVDVLACAHLRRPPARALITEPGSVRRILEHLGLDADGPPDRTGARPDRRARRGGRRRADVKRDRRTGVATRAARRAGAVCLGRAQNGYAILPSAERVAERSPPRGDTLIPRARPALPLLIRTARPPIRETAYRSRSAFRPSPGRSSWSSPAPPRPRTFCSAHVPTRTPAPRPRASCGTAAATGPFATATRTGTSP